MHLLHRSSKRLLFNRHLADFSRLALHPLNDRPHLEGDLAGNSSIKRFLVLFEDRFHYQGRRPLPPFSPHVAVCQKSNCRQELLEYSACEESVVSEADHSASSHAINSTLAFCKKRSDFVLAKSELDRDPKDTGSYKGAFLDLPVAESGTASTRTYKLKKQHDNELADGCKFSKSRGFGIHSCKAFLQILKRDFHTLCEEVSIVDLRMRSASMNERRQTDADGEFEGDAKEIPQNNTDERIEKQALESISDNIENLETGLHREDKEAVMSQVSSKLFVKGNISLLEEKDKEEKFNDVTSLHHGDNALKFAASSTKKRGRIPRPCERGYFTVLAKKKKNRRKKKNKKSWDAEMQLRPDELKKLSVAPPLDQIAAAGTGFFVEKPRVHGMANLPNYNLIMSKVITPVLHQESSGHTDLVDTNSLKMIKDNSLGQEVRKQFNCVEQLEEENASQDLVLDEELITNKHAKLSKGFSCEKGSSKLKEVSKDLGVNGEVFLMQESSREMEPKMIGKGKGVCNKDDTFFCYQNRGKLIVYDDFKASTSSDFYSKGWMTAHEELAKGVDGDVCHKAGASKVRYPLGNLSLNHVYVILDLNGVLIKRWDVNPSLPDVSKLNKRWIQLRPGCIEFLCKAFSKFKVGIWSTMTHKNVVGVCKLLEQQAHQSLPFFMLWSKDSCYQQRGVRRPDKSHVLADFKPLSHVWRFFEPYLGFHNTVLIDDSPYKACMNHPYNCIFPDAYEGCTDDDYLTHVLWPYLEKMRISQNLQAYIANNPLGQQPIVVGHKLYYHVQQVMDNFDHHIHTSGTGELIGKVESFKL